MVTDLRILRGSHRAVCVCRSGANSVAFVSAFESRAHNWIANACVIGFGLGSPLLLLLGNLSIYDEAIIWGLGLVSRCALFCVPISNSRRRSVDAFAACVFVLRRRGSTFTGDVRHALSS